MENLFMNLVVHAKNDKKKLVALKEMAVKCQNFELAANLREIERQYFPETEEEKKAKKEAKKLNLIFRMVKLNIPDEVAWLISETMKKYRRRRGNFDLKDAADLMDNKDKIFGK